MPVILTPLFSPHLHFSCCSCAWNILILIIVIAVIVAIAIGLGVYFGVYNTDDPNLNKQITDTVEGTLDGIKKVGHKYMRD